MKKSSACILSPAGAVLSADETSLLAEYQPFGMILMGRSCTAPEQVRRLTDAIWDALHRPCPIFIDQEGGRVARLKRPHWPEFPPFSAYAEVYRCDREAGMEAAFLGHRLIAAELEPLGIHADCAPVADLCLPGASPVIGDRSAGADPNIVADLAQAALDGLSAGGVAGVIKHIPGHGRANLDSHEALPVVTATREELTVTDFAPFKALRAAPMAMTAHVVYAAYDAELPATLSPVTVAEAIRGEIGFEGLVMSDDLGMKALSGPLEARGEAALDAGCDVVLHCGSGAPDEIFAQMLRVAGTAGPLRGASLLRAEAAEAAAGVLPDEIDSEAARSRLSALLAG